MISNKYSNLERAAAQGIPVPPCLHLQEGDKNSDHVSRFIEKYPSDRYIVRSAVSAEDGSKTAMAGVFYTSAPVTAEQLFETAEKVIIENRLRMNAAKIEGQANCMIMPYIEAESGGVLFSVWQYFHDHALVEFGSSPAKVVAGQTEATVLLSVEGAEDIVVSGSVSSSLQAEMRNVLKQLRNIFSFAMDVEWMYDGSKLLVLQVRPVTVMPTALKQTALTTYTTENKYQFDEYSESIGKVSPLSFSLLRHLYEHSSYTCEQLGIIGGAAYLERLPNGNVVTNAEQRNAYYKSRYWYSAFTRSFKKRIMLEQLVAEAETYVAPNVYDPVAIQFAFDRWRLAESLSDSHITPALPGEYELSNQIDVTAYADVSLTATWKRLFMSSLLPLRTKVATTPKLSWSSIATLEPSDKNDDTYTSELRQSIYTIQRTASDQRGRLIGAPVSGLVQVVGDPERWYGALPTDRILVVPYIPTAWIPQLQYLMGVATVSFGVLSHTAITLREHAIPTSVIDQETFETLRTGDELSL